MRRCGYRLQHAALAWLLVSGALASGPGYVTPGKPWKAFAFTGVATARGEKVDAVLDVWSIPYRRGVPLRDLPADLQGSDSVIRPDLMRRDRALVGVLRMGDGRYLVGDFTLLYTRGATLARCRPGWIRGFRAELYSMPGPGEQPIVHLGAIAMEVQESPASPAAGWRTTGTARIRERGYALAGHAKGRWLNRVVVAQPPPEEDAGAPFDDLTRTNPGD